MGTLDATVHTDELLPPPVMQRRNAGFCLEKLAHETAAREFQAVCNLCDGQVRVTQKNLDFIYDSLVNQTLY